MKDGKIVSTEIEVGGKLLKLKSGYLANLAQGSVLAQLGETTVLATVVSQPSREQLDYFPLGVEYVERLYAGGRIKGSRWVKREGRPSDEAILKARLIDRSIRPLFPKTYKAEVQVVVTVLSVDSENDPDVPAICATSAALALSGLPWKGPVGAIRLGYIDKDKSGKADFVVNPTTQDLEYSEMDMVISGSEEAVLMMEGFGREVPEEKLIAALEFASEEIKKICQEIKKFAANGREKEVFVDEKVDEKLVADLKKRFGKEVEAGVLFSLAHLGAGPSLSEVKKAVLETYLGEGETADKVLAAFEYFMKKIVRDRVLSEGKRLDGRKVDEIRPLTIEVGVLPRTHGSAMFLRGETQALTVATLGSSSLEQLIENMDGEETKRYMHHYYMPPFSVGETGRMGSPSRREIGHGDLAERALLPMIPSEDQFPYAIRVVSEIMASNGSSSMASVCGSTLALMDAGVPIKSPVAGIAMGLITEGKKYAVLTDIMGAEDFMGDMDFKIAGTEKGMTAIQLDVKNTQIPLSAFKEAFEQARIGRLFILDKMMAVLSTPRSQVSEFAPKIEVVHIPVEKIGELIGPGGRTIKKIIADTGANVDVEDDGSVSISSPDREAVNRAVAMVDGLTREVQVGEEFEGEVKRVEPFGAFVEITPGKDGLVHVSRMSSQYISDPNELVSVGQKVKVRVCEIDELKRVALTMLTPEEEAAAKEKRGSRPDSHRPGGFSPRPGGRPGFSRGRFPPRDRRF